MGDHNFRRNAHCRYCGMARPATSGENGDSSDAAAQSVEQGETTDWYQPEDFEDDTLTSSKRRKTTCAAGESLSDGKREVDECTVSLGKLPDVPNLKSEVRKAFEKLIGE